MRAEFTIDHQPGDLVAALRSSFGNSKRAALDTSGFKRKSPQSAAAIKYAAFGPGLRVLAWPTPGRLFLYVESSGGRLRKAAHDVWEVVIGAGANLNPSLKSLVLFDEDANDELARAAVGLRANVARPELTVAIVTGGVTAVVLAIGLPLLDWSKDLALGSIPAIVAAIIALLRLISDVRNKSLVWQ